MIACKSETRSSIGIGNGRSYGEAMVDGVRVIFLCAGVVSAQDAKTVLQAAQKAMGDVTSIQYSGTGQLNFYGQAFEPGGAWPVTNLTSYTKTIDFTRSRRRKNSLTRKPTPMVKGGGRPFGGGREAGSLCERLLCLGHAGQQPRAEPRRGHRVADCKSGSLRRASSKPRLRTTPLRKRARRERW